MAKLWKVLVETTVLVAADDVDDAAREALWAVRHGDHDMALDDATVCPVEARRDIPAEWIGSIPFGSKDDKRCEDYLPAVQS